MNGKGSADVLTVEEVLTLSAMAGAELVAGERGVSNPVEAAGVLDVSDLDSLKADQFVLSSVYPLRHIDLERLFAALRERGAAALGLKLSGYWREVPGSLVQAADRLGLPLLVLPEGAFDELVNPVLAAIASRQAEQLRRSAELHATLTQAALADHGEPAAVAEHLAAALRRPSAIFDERGEVVAWAGAESLWHREKLAERVLEVGTPRPITLGEETYFVTRIPGRNPSIGAICVHGVDALDAFGRAAIAHAAVVAGMQLLGRRQVQAVHRRFERELMEDLVERRIRGRQEARWRGRGIEWPLRRPYLVAVAGRPGRRAPVVEGAVVLDEATLTPLRRRIVALEREVRLFFRRPGLGIVVHLRSDDDDREIAARLADLLIPHFEALAAGDVGVGVSEPRRDIAELADAFREAALTLMLAEIGGPDRRRLAHFSDLGHYRMLAHVSNRRQLEAAAWSLLRPLDDVRLPRRSELVETLEALLRNNMNLMATSENLYFHYNTIRYRLSTLKQLLGRSLESPEGQLSLSLALAALQVLHMDRALQPGSGEVEPVWLGDGAIGP